MEITMELLLGSIILGVLWKGLKRWRAYRREQAFAKRVLAPGAGLTYRSQG
jgi:hypothetical protein